MATAEQARILRIRHRSQITVLNNRPVLEEELFNIVVTAANIGQFRTDNSGLARWAAKQSASAQAQIAVFGMHALLREALQRRKRGPNGLKAQRAASTAVNKARYEKSKAFDRIVTVLDTMYVGNNLLGDCKKPDLLRASVEAHRVAGEWDVKATLYKELAALLPDSETTVRKAAGRDKIVALLTTTFRE